MSDYTNIKKSKIKKFLKWLINNKEDLSLRCGGKHQYVLNGAILNKAFPICFKHNEINRHIVKNLMKTLVESGICTKEEFDEKIK